MKPYAVVFSPEAEADLAHLYDEIEADAGAGRAFGYTDRITAYPVLFTRAFAGGAF